MKRFLKVLLLLIIALFLLLSGMDAALDHLARLPSQSSYTFYNEKGEAILAYNGDLRLFRYGPKPGPVFTPAFIHRTKSEGPTGLAPVSTGA